MKEFAAMADDIMQTREYRLVHWARAIVAPVLATVDIVDIYDDKAIIRDAVAVAEHLEADIARELTRRPKRGHKRYLEMADSVFASDPYNYRRDPFFGISTPALRTLFPSLTLPICSAQELGAFYGPLPEQPTPAIETGGQPALL
jgi:hypothetical protein